MTAEYLLQNQDLLIEFIWKKLPKELEKEVNQVAENNVEISSTINDLIYLTIVLNLDIQSLKQHLFYLNQNILKEVRNAVE